MSRTVRYKCIALPVFQRRLSIAVSYRLDRDNAKGLLAYILV